MPNATIAQQIDEFNVGFNAQVGERLAAVFSDEQGALNADGIPASVVAAGDHLQDEKLVAAAIANGALDFTVLGDPANNLVRSLGLVTESSADARAAYAELGFDVADSNADATGDIPFPTVLIVSADRVVTFADVHVDYTTRTEVSEILAALDA